MSSKPAPPMTEQAIENLSDLHGGFTNWRRVKECIPEEYVLYRASAPWWRKKSHNIQDLPDSTLHFLSKSAGIKHVISLHLDGDRDDIRERLETAKIHYTPLPTMDWTAPKQDILLRGIQEFLEHGTPALIWCAAGCGRTGTMVTAIQMYFESQKPPAERKTFEDTDFYRNYVEEWNESSERKKGELLTGQYEALHALQKHLDFVSSSLQGLEKSSAVVMGVAHSAATTELALANRNASATPRGFFHHADGSLARSAAKRRDQGPGLEIKRDHGSAAGLSRWFSHSYVTDRERVLNEDLVPVCYQPVGGTANIIRSSEDSITRSVDNSGWRLMSVTTNVVIHPFMSNIEQ
ncbi:uncharacterized protein MKZ38_002667 [Zalerion maritima]|uniref:Tyrosine specific protein phosphatases domain-containing protein n=1 Tax=Zalerion maritima TaxID=339359 RepID=A0AAD5RQ75_9PEZI|nr:uncharacterized protein MKZ38_002667 [Zalerion maritima]